MLAGLMGGAPQGNGESKPNRIQTGKVQRAGSSAVQTSQQPVLFIRHEFVRVPTIPERVEPVLDRAQACRRNTQATAPLSGPLAFVTLGLQRLEQRGIAGESPA